MKRKILVLLLVSVLSPIGFAANRTIYLPGIWASGATTTIPENPVKGTTYRNTDFGSTEIEDGWPFDTIVYSEYYNQAQYIITSLLKQLEQQGILSWNSATEYVTGSLAMGSDMAIYIALQNSTNKDPVLEATYWKLYLSAASTSAAGIVQLSNSYSGTSQILATTEKALKDGLATTVQLSGNQTIAGVKTFSSTISGSVSGNAGTVTNGVYTTGNQTVGGIKTFSSFPVTPSSSPTTNYQAANKKYVDDSFKDGYSPTAYTGGQSITFPNGLILKHGRYAFVSTPTTVTFDTPFPNAVISAQASVEWNSTSGNSYTPRIMEVTTQYIKISNNQAGSHEHWQVWGY
jgi:hypothetical protein